LNDRNDFERLPIACRQAALEDFDPFGRFDVTNKPVLIFDFIHAVGRDFGAARLDSCSDKRQFIPTERSADGPRE
jgi:hypothetical protein